MRSASSKTRYLKQDNVIFTHHFMRHDKTILDDPDNNNLLSKTLRKIAFLPTCRSKSRTTTTKNN